MLSNPTHTLSIVLLLFSCRCFPFVLSQITTRQPNSYGDDLAGKSWVVSAIAVTSDKNDMPNILQPFPSEDGGESQLAILKFEKGNRLTASFHPCFDRLELLYNTNPEQQLRPAEDGFPRKRLQITDNSEQCPECTKPAEYVKKCRGHKSVTKPAASFVNALLYQVKSFNTYSGNTLILYDSQGSVAMKLQSCQFVNSDLAGTNWHPTSIHTNDGATIRPLDVVDRQSIYAKFSNHCEISGNSACNWYNGDYKTTKASSSSPKLQTEGVMSTLMYCDEPVNSIENAYMNALLDVAAYDISATRESLTLMDSNGTPRISLVPCTDTALVGSVWESTRVGNAWHNTGGKRTTAQFGEDGILRGTTTCSREYEVQYTSLAADNSIIFGTVNLSGEGCNQNDFEDEFEYKNAIKVESLYLKALKRARSFEIISCSDELHLRDKDGRVQVYFWRLDET